MDDRQLVCYSRNDSCSLRGNVCCVLLTLQIPYSRPKFKVLLPLKRVDCGGVYYQRKTIKVARFENATFVDLVAIV